MDSKKNVKLTKLQEINIEEEPWNFVQEKGRTTMKRRRMNEEQLREKSEKKEFYPKTYTISN